MTNAISTGAAPLRLLICAMGGEGGGVFTGWIVAAARAQGLAVQATSVPGVAQRTGGTTYYVEMAGRDAQGRAPVFALTPVAGQIDVVLASEMVEGARAARLGFATPDRTLVIASTHRVFLIQEKMAMGDGRLDPAALEATMRERARRATFLDMEAIALDAGVPISPVMLGALAGTQALPISRQHYEAAIRDGRMAVERNLAAFALAHDRVAGGVPVQAPESKPARAAGDYIIDSLATARSELAGFPTAAREVIARGIDRLEDYQDAGYAELYRQRIETLGGRDSDLVREAARQLALRMSYEDVIRVAQLKARAERFERIRGEVGASAAEPIEVQDFFKPGVREIADVMPAGLARFLLRRAERSKRLGQAHVGMKVLTTTISGYLRVWLLAKLKPWRRRTYRFGVEQAGIEAWLDLVRRATAQGAPQLAREIVELARLIKGYGDTHARGAANYTRIVSELVEPVLASATVPEEAAARVRAAREAALADPDGKALDAALAEAHVALKGAQAASAQQRQPAA